ncbi:MAG: DUF3048 domain-containing protein [Thermocrispum sp.]
MAAGSKEKLIALAGVAVVAAAVATVLVVLGDAGQRPAASAPEATRTTDAPTTRRGTEQLPAALVVKIDNVPQARPQTGLGSADAIYVEPVEGGYTRLLAVYWGKRPSVLGPVRSARETDVELLAYLRRPVLAYSGSAGKLAPILRAADLERVTPETAGGAFYRSGVKSIPHNMYVDPRELPRTEPVDLPLTTGPAPEGGKRAGSHRVEYRNATYDFRWSSVRDRWQISVDGNRMTSTEHGQLAAGTVVVQRVRIVAGAGVRDPAGSPSPVARTVGSGKATVLRDGRVFQGTWSRASAAKETTYRTRGGDPLTLGRGPVWVLLVPA